MGDLGLSAPGEWDDNLSTGMVNGPVYYEGMWWSCRDREGCSGLLGVTNCDNKRTESTLRVRLTSANTCSSNYIKASQEGFLPAHLRNLFRDGTSHLWRFSSHLTGEKMERTGKDTLFLDVSWAESNLQILNSEYSLPGPH